MSENPYAAPSSQIVPPPNASTNADAQAALEIVAPLHRRRRWIAFSGIVLLILAVLTGLAGVVALFNASGELNSARAFGSATAQLLSAVLYGWLGSMLTAAAGKLKQGFAYQSPVAIREGIDRIGLWFKVMGILIIIFLSIIIAVAILVRL